MKKSIWILAFISAAAIFTYCGGGGGGGGGDAAYDGGELTKEEAIEKVTDEVLGGADEEAVVARIWKDPLADGDVVGGGFDEEGEGRESPGGEWFVWIDDEPLAFQSHPSRYIYIDRLTGEMEVVDADEAPFLNGVPMWKDPEDFDDESFWFFGAPSDTFTKTKPAPFGQALPLITLKSSKKSKECLTSKPLQADEAASGDECCEGKGHRIALILYNFDDSGLRPDIEDNMTGMGAALGRHGFTVPSFEPSTGSGDPQPAIYLGDRNGIGLQQLRDFVSEHSGEEHCCDEIFIYYTGHGKRNRAGRHWLGMRFGYRGEDGERSSEKRLYSEDFAEILSGLGSCHIHVVMDACYSGGFAGALETVDGLETFRNSANAEERSYGGSVDAADGGNVPDPYGRADGETGSEFTSGFIKGLNDRADAKGPGEGQDSAHDLTDTGFNSAVENDIAAISGKTNPGGWTRLPGLCDCCGGDDGPVVQPPRCGDNVMNQPDEECDGDDLGTATCENNGFDGGTLSCTSECGLDTSECYNNQTSEETSGTALLELIKDYDPSEHWCFIFTSTGTCDHVQNAGCTIDAPAPGEGGVMSLDCSGSEDGTEEGQQKPRGSSPLPPLTGTINAEGAFSLSGTGVIATYPDILVTFEGTTAEGAQKNTLRPMVTTCDLPDDTPAAWMGATFAGIVTIGANGGLPGGEPATGAGTIFVPPSESIVSGSAPAGPSWLMITADKDVVAKCSITAPTVSCADSGLSDINLSDTQTITSRYNVDGGIYDVEKSYFHFTLPDLPEGTTIDTAIINLHDVENMITPSEDSVPIGFAAAPWDADELTWNNQPNPEADGFLGVSIGPFIDQFRWRGHGTSIHGYINQIYDGVLDNNGFVLGLGSGSHSRGFFTVERQPWTAPRLYLRVNSPEALNDGSVVMPPAPADVETPSYLFICGGGEPPSDTEFSAN